MPLLIHAAEEALDVAAGATGKDSGGVMAQPESKKGLAPERFRSQP